MSSRVRHLRDPQNPQKTLCGREATYRYRFTDIPTAQQNAAWLSCDRCRAKAIRTGMLTGVPAPAPAPRAPRASEAMRSTGASVVDTYDTEVNDYLARLGILEYRT